jgi:hypothetical protein
MQELSLFTKSMPPAIQSVKIYFSQKGMPDQEAEHFFFFYEKKHWKSKKGHFLKSWKNIGWAWIQGILSTKPWLFSKTVH